jgi:hypothetical protein
MPFAKEAAPLPASVTTAPSAQREKGEGWGQKMKILDIR